MSGETNDGGPAFPTALSDRDGISLRDWFAGQALDSGVCRTSVPEYDLNRYFGPTRTDIRRAEIIAAEAYDIADAMLARRVQT